MLHLKCVPCRISLRGRPGSHDGVGELCPGCGAPLGSVVDLADIAGFHSIRAPGSDEPGRYDRLAGCVDGLPGGRKAVIGQAQTERERCLDGGGSYFASKRAMRREELVAEARFRRVRLELYRAKVHSTRPSSPARLDELRREADDATGRLHRADQSAAAEVQTAALGPA